MDRVPLVPPPPVPPPPVPSGFSDGALPAYQKLLASAAALNLVTDTISLFISAIDDTLKQLNLGVMAWVRVHIEGPDYDKASSRFQLEELGYAKIKGKWGICLRNTYGDEGFPDQDDVNVWLFSDAPRVLRLKAIDKIPDLLRTLSDEADRLTASLKSKLANVQEIASALTPPKTNANVTGFTVKRTK